MAVQHVAPRPGHSNAVHGLEHGRTRARHRSARRRAKNRVMSSVMFVVAAGIVGGASYYLWEFYVDEQERNTPSGPVIEQRSADDVIDQLEDQPRWNGPGNPTFGVGDDQP